MLTQSFCVDLPSDMFQNLYRRCCDNHEVQYPDWNDDAAYEKFKEHIKKLWKEYGDDILAYLDGEIGGSYIDDIEWDNEIEVTKAVAIAYIDFCRDNPDIWIDIETYWKEKMMCAIEANAESIFDAEGPCDIYGEPLE